VIPAGGELIRRLHRIFTGTADPPRANRNGEVGDMKSAAILLAVLLASVVLQAPAPRAEEGHAAPSGPVYIAVAPLVISVIHAGDVRLHLTYVVQLEAEDADAGQRIRDQMPRLRDAYLRALAAMADRVGEGPPPDLERVKRTLSAASDRVLGPHVVNEVLIQRSVSRRPS
jgi:flagellar basal body-associated protein FliL